MELPIKVPIFYIDKNGLLIEGITIEKTIECGNFPVFDKFVPQEKITPRRMVLCQQKCQYTGTLENVDIICVPGDRLFGIFYSENYKASAVRDIKEWCNTHMIYPVTNRVSQFFAENGLETFQSKRTSGQIEDQYEINIHYVEGGATYMHSDGSLCIPVIRRIPDPITGVQITKHMKIDVLCQLNGVSEELKQKIIKFLKDELDVYYF